MAAAGGGPVISAPMFHFSLRGDKYQFSQKTFHKFIITASNTDPQR